MAFKVLVVDDSSFYRRRVKDILNEDRSLEVVGEAANGREAVEKVKAAQRSSSIVSLTAAHSF